MIKGNFASAQLHSGFWKGLPVMMGYFPIGFAFGILAANTGLTIIDTVLMSVFVYAGSAQLISLGLIEGGAGVLAIASTTFLVNLRHMLMSAALAPYLGHLSRFQQAAFSYELTDETFAVHSTSFYKEKEPPPGRIFATNILAHFSWIASSFLGAWTGSLLADLEAWGLDYALPAMFISLLVLQIGSKRHLFIAVFSLVFSTLLYYYTDGHWYILVATVIGATTGAVMDSKRKKELDTFS